MPRYSFDKDSLLDEVTLIKNETGGFRAYLHASEHASAQDLQQSVHAFSQKLNLQAVPTVYKGQAALEIRGIKKESEFLGYLETTRLTTGTVKKMPIVGDVQSLADKLKKKTLQASGAFYLLGDAAYMAYGYKNSHWEDVLAGAFYLGGSSALVGFGSKDQSDIEVRDLTQKVYRKALEYHKENDEHLVTHHTSLEQVASVQPTDVAGSAKEFLRRYPAETMNAFFGMAGMSIALGAMKHKVFEPPTHYFTAQEKTFEHISSWLDVGLGGMTAASGAVSTLVHEEAPDVNKPKEDDTTFSKIMDWVREKPLRVAGYGYMVSTLFHTGSTVIDMKLANKYKHIDPAQAGKMSSIPFRATFVGMNLVAEALMAMSSKGHGHGVKSDESVDDSVISIVADLVNKQNPKDKAHLVEYMAGFLSQPEVLGGQQEEVSKKLFDYMQVLNNNPWASKAEPRKERSERVINRQQAIEVPSSEIVLGEHDNWQSKLVSNALAGAPPQTSLS